MNNKDRTEPGLRNPGDGVGGDGGHGGPVRARDGGARAGGNRLPHTEYRITMTQMIAGVEHTWVLWGNGVEPVTDPDLAQGTFLSFAEAALEHDSVVGLQTRRVGEWTAPDVVLDGPGSNPLAELAAESLDERVLRHSNRQISAAAEAHQILSTMDSPDAARVISLLAAEAEAWDAIMFEQIEYDHRREDEILRLETELLDLHKRIQADQR